MTKTYIIGRKQWIELELLLSKIDHILDTAEEFDTSYLEKNTGVPALMFRGKTYIVNPKDSLSENL